MGSEELNRQTVRLSELVKKLEVDTANLLTESSTQGSSYKTPDLSLPESFDEVFTALVELKRLQALDLSHSKKEV